MAEEVGEALRRRGRTVIRASIDGFHRPRAERYRQGEDSPKGYYEDYIPGQQLYFVAAHPQQAADLVVENDDPARPTLTRRRL